MKSLTLTQNIVPVDDVENEFIIYYYTKSEWGEGLIEPYLFFKSSFNYALQLQTELLVESEVCLLRLIDDWWDPALPERYWPIKEKIKPKLFLDARKMNNIRTNLKSYRQKFEKYKSDKYRSELQQFQKKITQIKDIGFYALRFKTPMISLMEQKKIKPLTMLFFKKLIQNKGIDFDTYINNWIERLKQESIP